MENLHEKKLHGAPRFPFIVYPGNLPDYLTSYPLHWHEEMELIYVESGTGSITVQAEHVTVQTGDMMIIAPQNVHSIEQLGENTMAYYNILFRLSMLDTEYTGLLYGQGSSYLPAGESLNEKLKPMVLELIRNRKQIHTEYSLMIRSHLCAIVYHIIHDRLENGEPILAAHSNYDRLKVVLEYLQENYAGEITVEQAAAMCGFSSSHFMKLFRELTGTSFTQYVKQLRLEAAAKLLQNSGKRVGEIAEEVGFHNLPYFTRAFAEKYHISPGNYRKEK